MKIKLNQNDERFTLQEAFERYQKQSIIRNLSEYTIKYQNTYFKKFQNFIADDEFLISNVNINIIDDYIYFMMEQGNKAKSINTALIALNAFLHWCMDNNYCDRFKTKLVKKDEIIKDTYSDDQLLKLIFLSFDTARKSRKRLIVCGHCLRSKYDDNHLHVLTYLCFSDIINTTFSGNDFAYDGYRHT